MDKYQMFSNYMHNELGITKEDIRQWIKEAVDEQAKRLVQHEYDNFDVKKIVNKIIFDEHFFGDKTLKQIISKEFTNQLLEKITINIK